MPKNFIRAGCLDGSAVEHLPLAQDVIPEFWDQVPHQAAIWSLILLPIPVSLPLSQCLLKINNILKSKIKNKIIR